MKNQPASVLLVSLLLTFQVWAGAWDIGAFDNDDALDWIWVVVERDDLSVVASTLAEVSSTAAYIEATTGSSAVAAAEVVAAINGKPNLQLPPELTEWISAHDFVVDANLLALAQQAIALVQDTDKSELAQLWSESGELADEWRSSLAELSERLK
jgi:hypothetical protein